MKNEESFSDPLWNTKPDVQVMKDQELNSQAHTSLYPVAAGKKPQPSVKRCRLIPLFLTLLEEFVFLSCECKDRFKMEQPIHSGL